jgi:TPR repeat protein
MAGFAAVLAFAAAAVASSRLAAETRSALVVGNSLYTTGPLKNPKNDAEAVAKALTAVGFSVVKLIDADQKTMRRAIVDFGRRLRSADGVGLFYYAGHGAQVAGENYLVPIASEIKDTSEVPIESINLAEILKAMERSAGRTNIVILDACRNNPFPGAARSPSRGLAAVSAPSGTLVAFATAPGQIALDGDGANSPYSAALAANIPAPGLVLEEMFRRTRRQVLLTTNNRQTPWEHSSLTDAFFFNPKQSEQEADARRAGSATAAQIKELEDWDRIRDASDERVFQRHLAAYPDGLFAELARLKIADLRKEAPQSGSVALTSWVSELLRVGPSGPEAQALLERGLKLEAAGTPSALSEAYRLYTQAAEAGLPAAMRQIGRLLDKGLGTDRNLAQAAAWYRKAFELGDARAMAALGNMYEFGEGVPQDLVEALRLYRLAADADDANGMASLGYLFAQGKGVSRDLPEARKWYALAAGRGNTRAMYNLALMLVAGDGGQRDFAEAASLLQRAVDSGHIGALRELALLHDQGTGVPRAPKLAADYLLRAYKAGHREARVDLLSRPFSWSLATRQEIQTRLSELGLYHGRALGVFDAATLRAVEAFGQQMS